MRKILPSQLGALWRDTRGLSVVELSLAAPLLSLMILGVADLSMGLASKASLDQAAYRTLERATVGGNQSDYSYLQAEAAAAANVPASNVTVGNWVECNGTRQTSTDVACPSGQMTSRYVQLTINSTYTPFFSYGPLGRAFPQNSNGSVPISAVAAVRVE